MRVTVRHYYNFGTDHRMVGADLVNPDSWDKLRTKTTGAFALPATREEFVNLAETRSDIAARARAIDAWLEEHGAGVVASYGVGGAALEWWLHQFRPGRELILTEYGHATLARLRELFPEAQTRYHDLLCDEPIPADVHLFHRIDTELSNDEWPEVLRRFGSAKILIVAAGVLDARVLGLELMNRIRHVRSRGASRAGFIRSRSALEALWRPTHTALPLRVHDLDAWALAPQEAEPSRASAVEQVG